MPDSSYIIVDTQTQQQRPVKLHDNGDGTYSISTYGGGSGGSSIGGGNSVYSNVQGDFTATANSGTKTITFSGYASAVLSAVISNLNFLNAVILRRSSAGVVDTLPLSNVSFASNVLTLSGMTADFAVGDTVSVYVTGPDKGFDEGNDQQKVTLNSALGAHQDSISSKLATDAIMDGLVALTPKFAPINASSSGNNTIVAAVTSKKIRVLEFALSFSGAVNAKFQTGAGGTDLTGLFYGAANAQVPGAFNPVGKFETASGVLLNLNLSAATAVGGYVVYVEV